MTFFLLESGISDELDAVVRFAFAAIVITAIDLPHLVPGYALILPYVERSRCSSWK
jgi:hypothetical protein